MSEEAIAPAIDFGVTDDRRMPASTTYSLTLADHVAIVGGGFSGTLMAVNLLRYGDTRVTLIERGDSFARGAAYSTKEPRHLLNVRAGNMSALADQPDHFVDWLRRHDCDAVHGFASRRDYGRYLGALLSETITNSRGRLQLRKANVEALAWGEGHAQLTLAGGDRVRADMAVLAAGNLPPHDLVGLASAGLAPGVYCSNPWSGDLGVGLIEQDTVLVIGTGLTMIDVAVSLDAAGFRGKIVALSRRGLVPRPHALEPAPYEPLREKPPQTGSALVRRVRLDAERIGWRGAVDALRPFSQPLWLGASDQERSRFLRHMRTWWDVHRHRLAPQIAARLEALRADGRLTILSGKIGEVRPCAGGAEVIFRPRSGEGGQAIAARRIVNCTGPQSDLRRSSDPLLRQLFESGQIRADANTLGIDVNVKSEVVGADGRANPRLLALGPLTRGTFWEINAVPDIRVQAWSLARRLSAAHWVEGEGL
ncbi:MAG: FAD-dependent oxidoreductase [Candidatus Andeanibacterium colombiense]|uniref:FAD-dependent oxidoreductase n=1 Tax=Candidatus Andeanibacterium colombiense TaxID=3121345 RepID=A0AAJ5X5T4_9SPHN|nr:MAG: FAD-dependent oxidoreductase [Sphingomonadaceae bacterium]